MGSFRALTLAGVFALGAASVAAAADMPYPPPMPAPAPVVIEEFSGWYLRGDIGVGINSNPKLSTSPNPLNANGNFCDAGGRGNCYSGVTYNDYRYFGQRLSMSTFAALGVGYQLNNWLRFDVTGEYRGGAQLTAVDQLLETGTYTYIDPATGAVGFGPTGYARPLRNFYKGHVSSFVAMVNGYVDLGTWHGFTPFIGAGIGIAHNRLSGLTDQGFSYNSLNGVGSPTGGYWSDGKKTNVAWALMAGIGYSITPNLKLELGYRYMNLGKIQSGQSHCFNATGAGGGFSPCNFTIASQRLDSHDIRFGMRWMLGSTPTQAVSYQPEYISEQPLVRKY